MNDSVRIEMKVLGNKHFRKRQKQKVEIKKTLCRYISGNCTCVFKPGNHIACIFEKPEFVEKYLGRPVAGATGAALCCLFEMIRNAHKDEDITNDLCVQKVTIANSRYSTKPEECFVKMQMANLKSCDNFLLFGASAWKFYDDVMAVDDKYFDGKTVIKLVHLAHRGLGWIQCAAGQVTEEMKLMALARFAYKKINKKGVFDLTDFGTINPGYSIRKPKEEAQDVTSKAK